MKIDLDKNILKINIYYQLSSNNQSVKLQIKWGIKAKNSSLNLEKKYYDNISVTLKRV